MEEDREEVEEEEEGIDQILDLTKVHCPERIPVNLLEEDQEEVKEEVEDVVVPSLPQEGGREVAEASLLNLHHHNSLQLPSTRTPGLPKYQEMLRNLLQNQLHHNQPLLQLLNFPGQICPTPVVRALQRLLVCLVTKVEILLTSIVITLVK